MNNNMQYRPSNIKKILRKLKEGKRAFEYFGFLLNEFKRFDSITFNRQLASSIRDNIAKVHEMYTSLRPFTEDYESMGLETFELVRSVMEHEPEWQDMCSYFEELLVYYEKTVEVYGSDMKKFYNDV